MRTTAILVALSLACVSIGQPTKPLPSATSLPHLRADRMLSGTLACESFRVENASVVSLTENLIVRSRGDIVIEGRRFAHARDRFDDTSDEISITLESRTRIIIRGAVQAGDGRPGVPWNPNGGVGGRVLLRAPQVVFTGGGIAGGRGGDGCDDADGGNGGDAVVCGRSTSTYIDISRVLGGRGGNGGNGGAGGEASVVALSAFPRAPAMLASEFEQHAWQPLDDADEDTPSAAARPPDADECTSGSDGAWGVRAEGGKGGNGGQGGSGAHPGLPGEGGLGGKGIGGDGGLPGQPGQPDGAPGQRGQSGSRAHGSAGSKGPAGSACYP